MTVRQVISFSLAILLGLTSANAYVPQHLGGEGLPAQASALQVGTAILLDEGGTPRCRIGEHPSEYLTAEQLGEFYGANSQIDLTVLDGLRECDERDEAYARVALGAEEISYGTAIPPLGKVLLIGAALGVATSCLVVGASKLPINWDDNYRKIAGVILVLSIVAGGVVGLVGWSEYVALEVAGWSFATFFPSAGLGIFVCHKPENSETGEIN